jgi:hypothetical protein
LMRRNDEHFVAVRCWHIATGDILTASRRFRGIADVDEMAAVSTGERMTQCRRGQD